MCQSPRLRSGLTCTPAPPSRCPRRPLRFARPPVRLGEDNDYVYRDVLGLSEEEYDQLKAAGQVGMDYAPHVV